jgi:hypothetical protein
MSALGMLGDLALIEHDVFFRIDAAGDEGRGDVADRLGQLLRILPNRDGVQIDHAVDAVVLLLQCNEPGEGAKVIAEMQIAARLHAREHQLLEGHD